MEPIGNAKTDWHLDSAEARHAENPRTFFIPPLRARCALRPGERAKLLFVLDAPEDPHGFHVERMWVEITDVTAGRYIGRLLNEPKTRHVLRAGTEVRFGPEHVAAIPADPRELGYDPEPAIAVSLAALDVDAPPGELFWEPADDPDDSGWQAFVGNESQEYLDDPAHCRMANLGWFAERHPQIEIALRDPRQGRWTWDARAATYRHDDAAN